MLSWSRPVIVLISFEQMDSLNIWKSICESRLLANATFILLLNKMDLLHQKLKSGQSPPRPTDEQWFNAVTV